MRPVRAMLVAAAIVAAWSAGRVERVADAFAAWRDGDPAPVPAVMRVVEPPLTDPFAWVPPAPRAVAAAPAVVVVREPFLVRVEVPVEREARAAAADDDGWPGWLGEEPGGEAPGAVLAARAGTPPPARPAPLGEQAYRTAERGYSRLAAGDRRGAADAFRVALSMDPAHPSARLWNAERARLERRWRLTGYALLREAGDATLPAATPVLGGGSSALTLGFTPRPLARRPIEVYARVAAAQNPQGIDQASLQGAVGVGWRPFAGVPLTLSAERLIALGDGARDDWAVRLAGGAASRLWGFDLTGYGEAGVIGDRPDWFAGAQLTAERRGVWREARWAAGLGAWGAAQNGGTGVARLDAGPLVRLGHPKTPVTVQLDYRVRVAGDAAPGSGPAVTLSSAF